MSEKQNEGGANAAAAATAVSSDGHFDNASTNY